jgi:methylated-DNA-[protein]-cysteine S-methyltransferase
MMRYVFQTEIGAIGIEEADGSITNVFFACADDTAAGPDTLSGAGAPRENPLLLECARQIRLYLAGRLAEFTLPLKPKGTPFMHSVWAELRRIPYGRTASYSDIAAAVGNPKAVRAVGLANNRNPIPIIIPCHRVIGKDGSLTGYAGGLDLKRRLLENEAAHRDSSVLD